MTTDTVRLEARTTNWSERVRSLLRTVPLRVCGFAIVIGFLAPEVRGMPVGNRQLGQVVPAQLVTILDRASRLGVIATLAVAAACLVFSPRTILRSRAILIGTLLMALAVTLGAARGLLNESETRHALSHGQFVVPYIIALGLPKPSALEWRRLMFAMRVGFTVPAIYTLFLLVVNSGQELAWYTRIIPTGTSFGGVACLLWLAHVRQTGHRRYYFFAILCALGILVSGTRAWIVALALTLPIYALLHRRSIRDLRWSAVLGSLGVISAAVLFVVQLSAFDGVVTRTVRDFSGGSNLRVTQARTLLTEWADSPLFGSGLGYRNPDLARGFRPFESARPYLVELSYGNLLAKMGLVGFLLLASGMAILVKRLFVASRLATGDPALTALFGGTIYLLLTSVVNPTFESVYFHFFIAAALLGTLAYPNAQARSVVEAA